MTTTYFKPLRRKIGVVTLVLACVFMAGWVRSLYVSDILDFPRMVSRAGSGSSTRDVSLFSIKNFVVWQQSHGWSEDPSEEWSGDSGWFPTWKREASEKTIKFYSRVQWRWWGLGYSQYDFHKPSLWWEEVFIPYWMLVIPLTLLSAFLLLSKVRKKIEPTVVQPTENA